MVEAENGYEAKYKAIIVVNDVERKLKFYTKIFGMEIRYHKEDMILLTRPVVMILSCLKK
ncbi:MAG: hypothetical protein HC905_28725 [Bacteroidales bacterium]|nr:hypothetical protein [Bacteroidales bacterium]